MTEIVATNSENKDENFIFFYHSNHCLSNFYKCNFTVDGKRFTSTEQYFHFKKATLFKDGNMARNILATDNPMTQKICGRRVKKIDVKIWDSVRYSIMTTGLFAKFSQNQKLKNYIVRQYRDCQSVRFVEASPYDTLWGIGLNMYHPNIYIPSKWRGQNLLGICLDDVRKKLSEQK